MERKGEGLRERAFSPPPLPLSASSVFRRSGDAGGRGRVSRNAPTEVRQGKGRFGWEGGKNINNNYRKKPLVENTRVAGFLFLR